MHGLSNQTMPNPLSLQKVLRPFLNIVEQISFEHVSVYTELRYCIKNIYVGVAVHPSSDLTQRDAYSLLCLCFSYDECFGWLRRQMT